jgi:hypothetical protein
MKRKESLPQGDGEASSAAKYISQRRRSPAESGRVRFTKDAAIVGRVSAARLSNRPGSCASSSPALKRHKTLPSHHYRHTMKWVLIRAFEVWIADMAPGSCLWD